MRRLLFILLLCSSTVFAADVQQCMSEHFQRAKQYPDIPYERDRGIVSIWCTCEISQEKAGKTVEEAVKHCVSATNEPINNYLKSK